MWRRHGFEFGAIRIDIRMARCTMQCGNIKRYMHIWGYARSMRACAWTEKMHTWMFAYMHICVHAQSCYMQACIHTYKLAFPHACIHTCRSACRQSLILHVGMFTCIHAHIHTDNKWQERVAYANTFVLLVFNCAEKSRTTSRHSRIQYIIGRTHCMRVVIDPINYVSHPNIILTTSLS